MSRRIADRVLDGSISSVEELKAYFKARAKETHPDLADGGAEDFVRLRRDYEDALRMLGRSVHARATGTETDGGPGMSAADPFAAAEILLKRGFPKIPRHRQEALRYAFARIGFLEALGQLGEGAPELFAAFEEEALRGRGTPAAEEALRILRSVLRCAASRVPAEREAARFELARASPAPALGPSGGAAANGASGTIGPEAAAFLAALLAAVGA